MKDMKRHSKNFFVLPWIICLSVWLFTACDRPVTREESHPQSPPHVSVPVDEPMLVPLTNMVHIKAGTFLRMKHPVTLTQDFWMSRYEVTQSEFTSLMHVNPSHFLGQADAPVEKVKYYDAVAYSVRLTKRERRLGHLTEGYVYRLPTEAEWEYACRAGTTNLFSFGDSEADAEAYAWTLENSDERTHPVGQKKPNPWGLFDMHGNVWEWCLDWYGDYPENPVTDPIGPAEGKAKVFRGGGWNHEAPFARSANRFTMSPSHGIHFVGFRLVLAREI